MAIKDIFVTLYPLGKATPNGMMQRFRKKEIVELSDDSGVVSIQLFETLLSGGDISGYTEEQQSAAHESSKVLCRACFDADSLVATFVYSANYKSYETTLFIENLACDIARYYLYDIQVPEIVEKRYRDAIDMLTKIMNGQLKLEDSEQFAGYGVNIVSESPRFTLRTL